MNRNHLISYSILLIYILLLVLYHSFGYIGHYGYDDLHYANLSVDLLNGSLDWEDHYSYRFPVILLTASFYALFGISDLSSSLPALLITSSILVIVFCILKNESRKTLILGLSLTLFSNWFIFYSDKLMPDIYVAFSVISALAIIHKYKYRSNRKGTFLYSVILSLAVLFGFMAKGTIVLIVPLLLYLLLVDIFLKRDLKFWMYTIISGITLLVLYFLFIGLLTGDVLKRFETIANNSYLNLCSYDKQSLKILLERISFGFFKMTVYQGLLTGFIFSIVVLLRKGSAGFFKMNDSFSYFLISSIILLLSSNFMTISMTSYSPMCIDPRHYLFLVPVASISASYIIVRFLEDGKYGLNIVVLLAVVSLVSVFIDGSVFWRLYLPLFLLFLTWLLVKPGIRFQLAFTIIVSIILALLPLKMIPYAQKIKYSEQREIAQAHILDIEDECLVITNDAQKRLLRYYKGFAEDPNLSFVNFGEFKYDSSDFRMRILMLNWYTRYLSNLDDNDLPYYARNISGANKLIYKNEELSIRIYEMLDFKIPLNTGKVLVSSLNDFEKGMPYWSQTEDALSSDIKYAGDKSNQVSGFSSTFVYPVDSLQISESHNLLINCSLFCYFEDDTKAKIIISLENDSGAYVWEGKGINKFINAYSNWWPVEHEVEISKADLKDGSNIMIYVLNEDKKTAYIDNFEVSIQEITPAP